MANIQSSNGVMISDGSSPYDDLSLHAMYTHAYTYDGTEQFRVGSVPNSVEFLEVRGGIVAAGPTIYANSDTSTDVNLSVACKGNGGMTFENWFGPMFTVQPAPGEIPYNYIQFLGRSSGNPASIFFSGADTNVNGYLSAQGSGIIYVANSSGPIGANSAPIGQFGNSSGAACTDQFRIIGQASGVSKFNIQFSGLAGGDVSIGGTGVDGGAVLPTGAVRGFLRIPQINGTPTATPAIQDNFVPICFDKIHLKLYVFSGGAWVASGTFS